jgi:hypothetical protein
MFFVPCMIFLVWFSRFLRNQVHVCIVLFCCFLVFLCDVCLDVLYCNLKYCMLLCFLFHVCIVLFCCCFYGDA